jgi:uncharacterized protein (TIGR03000 family)
MEGKVLINVHVMPDAEVWFDGQKTSQTGAYRSFISPALNPDQEFVYHIRARWTENGREVDKTRKIDVHAGDRLLVNFMGRQQEGMGGTPSGQYGTQPPAPGTEPGNRGEETQPGNATPTNPPTRTDNRSLLPPNKISQPPVKQ